MSKHRNRLPEPRSRRDQFTTTPRRDVPWNWIVIACGLVFLGTVLYISAALPATSAAQAQELQPAETVPSGQDFRLSAATLTDGKARYFRYVSASGRELRFFVLRSADGVIRAAFDACAVCYRERRGYHQAGDNMICNNCGKAFRSVDVNVITGGCNPEALRRSLAGDQVLITSADLDSGAIYF